MLFKILGDHIDNFSSKCSLINRSNSTDLDKIPTEIAEIRKISISIYNALVDVIISGKFTSDYNYKSLITKINEAYDRAVDEGFDSSEDISLSEESQPTFEIPDSEYDRHQFFYEIDFVVKECLTCIVEWLEKTNKLSKIALNDIVNNDTTWINKDTSLLINDDTYFETPFSDLSSHVKSINNLINLYYIDFNLNCDLDQLLKLRHIKLFLDSKEAIESLSTEKRTALKCKVDFLSLKIIKANNRKHEDLKFSIDENIISINEREYAQNLSISNHYDILFSNDNINHKYTDIKYRKYENYSYQDYFISTKYFKYNYKNNPINSIESINKILSEFKRTCEPNVKTPFDRWAYERSYIFIYNNLLSLELKNENISHDTITKLYHTTVINQSNFNVKNYYPFLKICIHVKNEINNLINYELNNISSTSESKSNHDTINSKICFLDNTTKHLDQCVKWSESHLNWAFQPDFNSCTDTIETNSSESTPIDIFNASAFIVPINYNNVKEQVSIIKEDIKHFKSQLEILKTTNLLNQRLDSKMKEVDGISKKNVEILSVFAAIVLFTIGNIQIFKEANSINDALLFMISFAYVIGIFVLLIRQITKENEQKNTTEKKVLWTLIGSTVVVIGYLFWSSPSSYPSPKKDETINVKLSSPIPGSEVQQKQPSSIFKASSSKK